MPSVGRTVAGFLSSSSESSLTVLVFTCFFAEEIKYCSNVLHTLSEKPVFAVCHACCNSYNPSKFWSLQNCNDSDRFSITCGSNCCEGLPAIELAKFKSLLKWLMAILCSFGDLKFSVTFNICKLAKNRFYV